MRPVPVPAFVRRLYPGRDPLVIAGPSGDVVNDPVAAVDVLPDVVEIEDGRHAAAMRLYLRPEGDDVDRLRDGALIEVTLFTTALPVFQVRVLDDH